MWCKHSSETRDSSSKEEEGGIRQNKSALKEPRESSCECLGDTAVHSFLTRVRNILRQEAPSCNQETHCSDSVVQQQPEYAKYFSYFCTSVPYFLSIEGWRNTSHIRKKERRKEAMLTKMSRQPKVMIKLICCSNSLLSGGVKKIPNHNLEEAAVSWFPEVFCSF